MSGSQNLLQMTAEKTAVLVVTGVVAVLLALTLARSRPEEEAARSLAEASTSAALPGRDSQNTFVRVKSRPGWDPPRWENGSEQGNGSPRLPGAARTYRVRSGDSLEKIARRIYGKRSSWRRIYQANRRVLRNPNRIQEGMRLVIP